MKPVSIWRHLLFWLLVCAACGWDLYTKNVIFASLGGVDRAGPWTKQFAGIEFEYATTLNRGALWGLGQGLSLMFAGLSVVAIGIVLYWLFVKRYANSLWLTICLALLMGGTLGNLYDRLGLHGLIDKNSGGPAYAVRDFLHFTLWGFDWPVFNFADVFLVTGAMMLALHTLFAADATEQHSVNEPPHPQTAADKSTITEVRAAS